MDRRQLSLARLAEIRADLAKPVQSQFIRSDVEYLLSEIDRLTAQDHALRKAAADVIAPVEFEGTYVVRSVPEDRIIRLRIALENSGQP